jgi:type III restriction enzyme
METNFYKSGMVFLNERIPYDRTDVKSFPEKILSKIYKVQFPTGYSVSSNVFENTLVMDLQRASQIHKIINFGNSLIRKALNKHSFYRFNNIKKYFPNITSVNEFITSVDFLGEIKVQLEGDINLVSNPSKDVMLKAVIQILDDISKELPNTFIEFKGNTLFKPHAISNVFKEEKILNFTTSEANSEHGLPQSQTTNTDLYMDLNKVDWYAFNDNFGTTEEKFLVKYLSQPLQQLRNTYEEIFLLRNENHFNLYAFEDGATFQPDFVLFLKNTNDTKSLIYQLFIEPKGEGFIEKDKWKQDFLLQINSRYKVDVLFENKVYKLLGLPFYNETKTKSDFDKAFATFAT